MTFAVAVYCGSSAGRSPAFREAAESLGQLLAARQIRLVYGGGSTGMMGILADSLLAAGGTITGIIPRHLQIRELIHPDVSDMRVTADMHERKALMHELSDCALALPGGFGTLEELFECVTWSQLEIHRLPVAVWNVDGFYDGLISHIKQLARSGFISADCLQLIRVLNSEADIIAWLTQVERGLSPDTAPAPKGPTTRTNTGPSGLMTPDGQPLTKIRWVIDQNDKAE